MTTTSLNANARPQSGLLAIVFLVGAGAMVGTLIALVTIGGVESFRPHSLPQAPEPTAGGIKVLPLPTNAATEPITISTRKKDRERMTNLLRHDVTQHGGYVLELTDFPDEHQTVITLVSAADYAERLERIGGERSVPDAARLGAWAREALGSPARMRDRNEINTRFEVVIDSATYDSPTERLGLIAASVALGVSTAVTMLTGVVALIRR